MIVKTLDNLC